jgi:hypothetical protein
MANRQVRRLLVRGIGMLEAGRSQRHVVHVLLHAGGRERSTTQAQDRFFVLQAWRQRSSNATTLRNDFQNATGVRMSTQTVRNRLHDAGLRSQRPALRIPLTQCHIQERLPWAQIQVTWTVNDWTPVLFTDEFKFCMNFTERLARVWRNT